MTNQHAALKTWLKTTYSICVPDGWLDACLEWIQEESQGGVQQLDTLRKQVYEQWLLSDLRDLQEGCLPAELQTAIKVEISGTFALQVDSAVDIGKSFYSQIQKLNGTDNPNAKVSGEEPSQPAWEPKPTRMILLHLTDGVNDVKAMEYRPIAALTPFLTPGTKILVKGPVLCRRGMVMLGPSNVRVLGGEVDTLIETNTPESILSAAMQDSTANSGKSDRQEFSGRMLFRAEDKKGVGNKNQQSQSTSSDVGRNNNIKREPLQQVNPQQYSSTSVHHVDRETLHQPHKPKQEVDDLDWEEDFDYDALMADMESDTTVKGHNPVQQILPGQKQLLAPGGRSLDHLEGMEIDDVDFEDEFDMEMSFSKGRSRVKQEPPSQNDRNESKFANGGAFNSKFNIQNCRVKIQNFSGVGTLDPNQNNSNISAFPDQNSVKIQGTAKLPISEERDKTLASRLGTSKLKPSNPDCDSRHTSNDDLDQEFEDDFDVDCFDTAVDTTAVAPKPDVATDVGPKLDVAPKPDVATAVAPKPDVANHGSAAQQSVIKASSASRVSPSQTRLPSSDCTSGVNTADQPDPVFTSMKQLLPKAVIHPFSNRMSCAGEMNAAGQVSRVGGGQRHQAGIASYFGDDRTDVDARSTPGESFTYLSRILPNLSSVHDEEFVIKGYISTLTSKLTSGQGKVWNLSCKVNDGTAVINVNLANSVLTKLIGFTAEDSVVMKQRAKYDAAVKDILTEGLQQCQQSLIDLSCLMTVRFHPGDARPVLTQIIPVTSAHVQSFIQKVKRTAFL